MTGRSEAAHSISVGLETKSFGDRNSLMISASLTSQIETESTCNTKSFILPLPGAKRIFLTKPLFVVMFLEVLVRTSQIFKLPSESPRTM